MAQLAIDGGTPVRSSVLPYGRQVVDEEDVAAVVEVLRSGWLTTGPAVAAFEETFTEQVGAAHAVAVNSGTAALHAAAHAAGVGPGDEVIVPPLTFAATANCVRYLGGTVVFADISPDTLTLDPQRVAEAISPRTRAIIPVHFAGLPADIDDLHALARRHGLVVIEDAAHALGARYKGRRVGALSELSAFSFHPVKHITTGEGGLLTTDSADLAARARRFRTHGISADYRQRQAHGTWLYEMVELGFNYRITDLQCALGRSQLFKHPGWLRRRVEIAEQYDAAFARLNQVERPPRKEDRESAWHLYVLRLRLDRLRVGRGEVFGALRAENIGVNVHYIPVPWHPYYAALGYRRGSWPVAEAEYERMISLPLFAGMSNRDVCDVIDAVVKVIEHYTA